MSNIYYEPKNCGVEIVGVVEEEGLSYAYNMFAVWRRPLDGKLFYAQNSGCSCPSPFEDYHKVEDLEPIVKENFLEFEKVLMAHSASEKDKLDLRDKVRELLDNPTPATGKERG